MLAGTVIAGGVVSTIASKAGGALVTEEPNVSVTTTV